MKTTALILIVSGVLLILFGLNLIEGFNLPVRENLTDIRVANTTWILASGAVALLSASVGILCGRNHH